MIHTVDNQFKKKTHVYFPAVAPPLADAISGVTTEARTAAVDAARNWRRLSSLDSDVDHKEVALGRAWFWTLVAGATNAEAYANALINAMMEIFTMLDKMLLLGRIVKIIDK